MSVLKKKNIQLALVSLVFVSSFGLAGASVKTGKAIVKEKCLVCHNIAGDGMQMASDLAVSYKEHDQAWIRKMIAQPSKMLVQDPVAKGLLAKYNNVAMPDLGLSDQELDDVMAFLDALANGELDQAASGCADDQEEHEEQEPVLEGDVLIGKQLFTGEQAFKNKAASCIACHNSGTGVLGGGNFGTDLSHAYDRYKEGFPKVLKQLPFPSMVAIYKDHELTAEERYHLTAYFKEMNASNPVSPKAVKPGVKAVEKLDYKSLVFVGLSVIGFAFLFFLITALLPERNKGVREELLEKVRREKNK